jgi:hypothetical protein
VSTIIAKFLLPIVSILVVTRLDQPGLNGVGFLLRQAQTTLAAKIPGKALAPLGFRHHPDVVQICG